MDTDTAPAVETCLLDLCHGRSFQILAQYHDKVPGLIRRRVTALCQKDPVIAAVTGNQQLLFSKRPVQLKQHLIGCDLIYFLDPGRERFLDARHQFMQQYSV